MPVTVIHPRLTTTDPAAGFRAHAYAAAGAFYAGAGVFDAGHAGYADRAGDGARAGSGEREPPIACRTGALQLPSPTYEPHRSIVWVASGPRVVALAVEGERDTENASYVDAVAETNVNMVLEQIRSESAVLAEMEASGEIALVGAMYDVSSGEVRWL